MGAPGDPPGYPHRWEADVVLADGSTMHVRPIRPDDARRIVALHGRLSAETIYLRFFTPVNRLSPRLLERFTVVDYTDRMALVGVLGDDVIAVARYESVATAVDGGREAEVAFLVADDQQGRGIGTVMLEHLAAAGRAAGITRFVADTLPVNARMLRVFHDAGFDDVHTFTDGVVRVAFPIAATASSVAASAVRERRAAAASVRRLLAPRSVAVVGASTRPGTLGHVLVRSILGADFDGPVYPVHPTASHVAGATAYRSVLDIVEPVDLAVVLTPAAAVASVAEQCARKHVAGIVIISSGFAERGHEGVAAERALVAEVRGNGMRLIGPNCMGVVNTDPAVRLNATFSPSPPSGGIGFVASSGALGVVILDEVARRGLGVSTFVSVGNKADVSGNDLLQYWDDDERTRVVCMYIESFGNPRTFARVARQVATTKPVVAVKSGRSAPGWRASGAPHRLPEDDLHVDALFRQAGVIRTDTLEELFDVTQVLVSQPLPPGRRVAIVGNNGGPGALAADACVAAGLDVDPLGPATTAALDRSLGDRWVGANPVGLPPDARPDDFAAAVTAVLADPEVDAVIALYASPLAAPLADVGEALATASATAADKPVLTCALGRRGLLEVGGGRPAIPSYAFPEAAARALGAAAAYAAWRHRGPGTPLPADIDHHRAAAVATGALAAGRAWLDDEEVDTVLDACGIDHPDRSTVTSAGRAVAAAAAVGYPVVLRADPDPADTGGRTHLRVGLADAAAVRSAWAALAQTGRALAVSPLLGPGLDVVVGVAQDPQFGTLVTLARSAGSGVPPRRRAARSVPLTDLDVDSLVEEVDDGWSPGERRAISEVLARTAGLADAVATVAELEINPLIVGADGAHAASCRLRVAPVESRPERALRRLS